MIVLEKKYVKKPEHEIVDVSCRYRLEKHPMTGEILCCHMEQTRKLSEILTILVNERIIERELLPKKPDMRLTNKQESQQLKKNVSGHEIDLKEFYESPKIQ